MRGEKKKATTAPVGGKTVLGAETTARVRVSPRYLTGAAVTTRPRYCRWGNENIIACRAKKKKRYVFGGCRPRAGPDKRQRVRVGVCFFKRTKTNLPSSSSSFGYIIRTRARRRIISVEHAFCIIYYVGRHGHVYYTRALVYIYICTWVLYVYKKNPSV